jgi:hypothetical protein
LIFKALTLFAFALLTLAAWQARLPPHLPQEYDALNYHMALPRQHLLHGSLGHLAWSAADLWPMPLQYGLAPYWFMTTTINKWPQFAMTVWGFLLLLQIGRRTFPHSFMGWIPALAVYTSHGLMIQMGTAMLDLSVLYLWLAMAYSFLKTHRIASALHLGLLTAAKAFGPIQMVLVGILLLTVEVFLRRSLLLGWLHDNAWVLIGGSVLSCVLLARSVVVSQRYAGTPLFPFATCIVGSSNRCKDSGEDSIRKIAKNQLRTRDAYGRGRTLTAWIRHLWRVAIPTRGVNNEFDYPLGLPWLLWVLFSAYVVYLFPRGVPPPFAWVLAIILWVVWWEGSQQSRWLYPVLAFGWLGTRAVWSEISHRLILVFLLISAGFSLVSETRALKPDLVRSARSIEEEQMKRLEWDPQSGELLSRETLYVDYPLISHGHPDGYWILPVPDEVHTSR